MYVISPQTKNILQRNQRKLTICATKRKGKQINHFDIKNKDSVPIKGSRFANYESFLDFHESFFENILKLANSFSCY